MKPHPCIPTDGILPYLKRTGIVLFALATFTLLPVIHDRVAAPLRQTAEAFREARRQPPKPSEHSKAVFASGLSFRATAD
ncbi:MAG: hypothetical protein ACRCWF_03350 [Beijerinckiaceae bacterium]